MIESSSSAERARNSKEFGPQHMPIKKRYEILHPIEHKVKAPEKSEGPNAEKRKEWLDLAKAKLELVQDKAQMDSIIEEFNGHFDSISLDEAGHLNLRTELLVSVPEGDFNIRRNNSVNKGNVTEKLIAFPLPNFEIGNMVKVNLGGKTIDSGWEIEGFDIQDTPNGVQRILNVKKSAEGQVYRRKVSAKELREANQ